MRIQSFIGHRSSVIVLLLVVALAGASLACYLLLVTSVFAQGVDQIIGTVSPPPPIAAIKGNTGEEQLGTVFSSLVTLIFGIASVAFVFMIVWGAFQWIISGGDKEALAAARKRIVNAIIGIILLALSFVIITIIGVLTGFKFYAGQENASKVYQEYNVTGGKGFDKFTQDEMEKQKKRGGN